jgi:hypothetical protein
LLQTPVAKHPRLKRQIATKRFDRMLGLPLLREGEAGIENDDHDDRHP